MSDLSSDSRTLITLARRAEACPPGARERVQERLVLAIGAGATSGAAATAALGAGSAGVGKVAASTIATWLLVGGAVGGVTGAVATWSVQHDLRPRSVAARPEARPSATVDLASAESCARSLPSAAQNECTAQSSSAYRALGSGAASGAPSTIGSVGLRSELDLLEAAQRELGRGAPARALALLERHAREFPNSALTEERAAQRSIALCTLEPSEDDPARLAQFQQSYPASPLTPRVREACDRNRIRDGLGRDSGPSNQSGKDGQHGSR